VSTKAEGSERNKDWMSGGSIVRMRNGERARQRHMK
jgi:hypothetical protein